MRLVHGMGYLEVSLCPPARVTARVLVKAYINYASKHQGRPDRPAAEMAFEALQQAYPCGPTRE